MPLHCARCPCTERHPLPAANIFCLECDLALHPLKNVKYLISKYSVYGNEVIDVLMEAKNAGKIVENTDVSFKIENLIDPFTWFRDTWFVNAPQIFSIIFRCWIRTFASPWLEPPSSWLMSECRRWRMGRSSRCRPSSWVTLVTTPIRKQSASMVILMCNLLRRSVLVPSSHDLKRSMLIEAVFSALYQGCILPLRLFRT